MTRDKQQSRESRWPGRPRVSALVAGLAALAVAGVSAVAAPAPVGTQTAIAVPRPAPMAPPTKLDRRQAIDCAASGLSVLGRSKCWAWTYGGHAVMRYDHWTEDSQDGPSCAFNWQAADFGNGGFIGYVRYVALPRDASIWCSLGGWGYVTQHRMGTISGRSRGAADLTVPVRSGDRFVSSFTSSDGRACRAFIVLGPGVVNFRFKDSRAYHIEGDLCAPVGTSISDADIDPYIASIKVAGL